MVEKALNQNSSERAINTLMTYNKIYSDEQIESASKEEAQEMLYKLINEKNRIQKNYRLSELSEVERQKVQWLDMEITEIIMIHNI